MEYSNQELLMLINNKMISFDKDIHSRDWLELAAGVIVMLFFGYQFFTASSLWTMTGSAVLVFSCLFIAYKLLRAKAGNHQEREACDRGISTHLRAELQKVKRQKKLLQSVLWWYIAPICAGLLIYAAGFNGSTVFKAVYMIIVILMGIGIWYMNQKAVVQKFDPLIDEIRQSLEFLEAEKNM